MNVFNYLSRAAAGDPDGAAVCLGAQVFQSWSLLQDRALALAEALSALGKAGDRVLIASPNCAEYPEIMFGIWAAGMAVVPINAKLHVREIAQIIEDAEPVTVLASSRIADALRSIGQVAISVADWLILRLAFHDLCAGAGEASEGRSCLAVLHKRDDGTIEGCDAYTWQSGRDG